MTTKLPKEIPVPCSTSSIWPLIDKVFLEYAKWALDLDAARRERDNAEAEIADWKTSLFKVSSERDTAQARCAELEKERENALSDVQHFVKRCAELERELHERKWAQGHVIEHGKEIGCGLPDLPPYTPPEIRPATPADNEAIGLASAQEQGEAGEWFIKDCTGVERNCQSFKEAMDKHFEGFNLPYKKPDGKQEPFEVSYARVSTFYKTEKRTPPTPGAKQSEDNCTSCGKPRSPLRKSLTDHLCNACRAIESE